MQKINSNHLLKVDGLSVSFVTRNGIARAVEDISFTVDRGKTTAIIGESGSGKTLMGLTITKLLDPAIFEILSGEIIYDDNDILKCSEDYLRSINKLNFFSQLQYNHVFQIEAFLEKKTYLQKD